MSNTIPTATDRGLSPISYAYMVALKAVAKAYVDLSYTRSADLNLDTKHKRAMALTDLYEELANKGLINAHPLPTITIDEPGTKARITIKHIRD